MKHLVKGCSSNNLIINVSKTKEMIVDFRRKRPHHTPLHINNSTVEKVSSTKFLGVQITEDLTWSQNTAALVKKGQQRLHFLCWLRRAHLPSPILNTFYRGTIESVLTSCIFIWAAGCKVSDWKALQRVVRTAEKIIWTSLSPVQDIAQKRCVTRALRISTDPSHPQNGLFSLLASGRGYCSIRCRTTRFCNSFIPQAIRLLNSR